MTTAVPLALFIAFILSRLRQLFRLGFQQSVWCFFNASLHKFFQLPLDYFFFQSYNFLRYSLLSFQNGVSQLLFY